MNYREKTFLMVNIFIFAGHTHILPGKSITFVDQTTLCWLSPSVVINDQTYIDLVGQTL